MQARINRILSRSFGTFTCSSVRLPRTPETSFCSTCSALDITAILRKGCFQEDGIHLGRLVEIIQKADHCRFCHLITSLFRTRWCLDALPDVDLSDVHCSLYATSIGTLVDPDLKDRKRCHRLCIDFSRRPPEVTSALQRAHMDLQLSIQLLEEDAHKVRRAKELHGRRVTDTVDIEMLKGWLSLCEREHGDACAHRWWGTSQVPLPHFVRVIDTASMSLVQAPSDCRYIALSYVWGVSGESYQTTRANVDARSHPAGFDISTLPATIVDAIHVTRMLGERYLWVDVLCIIQDSSDHKAEQIHAMDLVYSKAVLTIFAAGGDNAHAKLPGVSPGSRMFRQHIKVIQGLHLALPLPVLLEAITESVWDTRGWTHQELFVSRRRLFFTKYQVYFECAKDVWCEDIVAESKTVQYSRHPMRYSGSSARLFMPQLRLPESCMRTYINLVQHYTRRRLTYPSDIIFAITALTNVMTRGYELGGGDPDYAFRYGMLVKDLDLSLLWQPRLDSDHTRRVPNSGDGLSHWPSWAWAGWIGAALYSHAYQLTTMIIESTTQVKPAESLVGGWYLVDDESRLVRLDAERINFIRVLGREEPPQRYKALAGEIDEHTLGALPPHGTLIFRTQCSSFKVSKLEMTRADSGTTSAPQAIFEILSDIPTCAGRIILPSTTPCSSVFTFIVLSRCQIMNGLYDEDTYGQYEGGLLYVMAVKWAGDGTVRERVGLGVISEQAWLTSNAEEEIVFLG